MAFVLAPGCGDVEPEIPLVTTEASFLIGSISDSVATGAAHSCAIVGDGAVRCWGSNQFGQLGFASPATTTTPTLVSGISTAVAITAGDSHTCVLLSNRQIRCWGYNGSGQLGNGSTQSSSAPVAVSGISTAIEVSAGGEHTCALLLDGTARCWGRNNARQLGNLGSTTNSSVPVTVQQFTIPSSPPLSGITHIAAGGAHSCATLTGGGARCWGQNTYGALGVGNTGTINGIASVALAAGEQAIRVAAGKDHSCVALSSGGARC